MEMKFYVNDVLPSLSCCASLVPTKNVAPILSYILVETYVDANGTPLAKFTASDGENFLAIPCKITSCDVAMRFCVDANDFLKALRNLSDSHVTITVVSGKTLTCEYENGHFVIPCNDAETFPPSVNVNESECRRFGVDAKKLSFAIDKASVAMGNDPIRPILSGLNFAIHGNTMTVVGTDAQRLVKIIVDGISNNDNVDGSFTLPSKPVSVLRSLVGDGMFDVKFSDRHVVFSDGESHLTARLTEGNYPKYSSILPISSCSSAIVAKNEFASAVRRTAPMGNTTSNLIVLEFNDGKVTLSTEDVDFMKSAKEDVLCTYADAPFKIGFKASYLSEMVANINDENVCFELRASDTACIVRPVVEFPSTEYISLIMPMMIE